MKVICVNYGNKSPLAEGTDYIKEGQVYTVRCEETGFSTYAQREVEAYGFEEIEGLYEKGMFMLISNIDEGLIKLLRTKPLRK
jgi:hypothetical protein